MQAGRLDQRVTLERYTTTVDDWGQPTKTWTPIGTFWAAVEPLAGREFIAAQAAQSEVTTRVRVRWRPGVTSRDRLVHDGATYGIESVIDIRSQHRELVLMCKSQN